MANIDIDDDDRRPWGEECRTLGAKAYTKSRPIWANPFIGPSARAWTEGWKFAQGSGLTQTLPKSRLYRTRRASRKDPEMRFSPWRKRAEKVA